MARLCPTDAELIYVPQEYNTAEKSVVCRVKIGEGARTVAVGTSLMTLADAMPESLKL